MELFIKVVEAKSFTDAARGLGITPSAVSKQITRLEDRLGAQLLNRTTRRIAMTDVGAAYYERCVRIMAEVEEAEAVVSNLHTKPRGLLRVSVPVILGQLHFAPAVAAFLMQYAEVQLELILNDRYVNLIEEGFDIVVRIDELPDSSMVALRLAPNRRVVCAAPEYFRAHGTPETPDDLMRHNCLTYGPHYPHKEWFFRTDEGRRAVRVSGNFQTNNAQALRLAALGGLGMALLPTFIVGGDLRQGLLHPVLSQYVSSDTAIYAVYPHSRHLSPKVRAFVDFMAKRFGPNPSWDDWAQPQAPGAAAG
jgi:DNA-binding transcriptional LysR family regulator